MSGRPIAVVHGDDRPAIQRMLVEVLGAAWRPPRIAGVIEMPGDDTPGGSGLEILRSVRDGSCFALFQDLGPGSTACSLDPGAVAQACAAICRDIAAGCDLVLLSKFGKLEAESGAGLLAAFAAAMEAGIPIVTSVSPHFLERWDGFAAPYYQTIGPDLDEIAAWWAVQSPAAASSASR